MKAVQLSEPAGALQLVDIDRPSPGPGEILIKVEASGVCYTDVHLADGDWAEADPLIKRDLTLGHEGIGIIEELGAGVSNRSVGDRVAAPFIRTTCGNCRQCRCGEENHCPNVTVLGLSHDGSHAEFVVAHSDFVVAVPDRVSPTEAAPLACAGMSVLGALRRAEVSIGQSIGIIGIGGQGHLAVQVAKLMGATVVAIDIDDKKLELARNLGADHCVNVTDSDAVPKLIEMGMEVVMITAPSHEAHQLALGIVCNGGTLSLCAVPAGETPISMTQCAFKGVKLLAQAVATRQDLADILDLAAAGSVRCEIQTRPLSSGPQTIADLRSGKIVGRVVLVP